MEVLRKMLLADFQVKRDTSANWASNNPTLLAGVLGYDSTNKAWKLGDGATAWNSLPRFRIPAMVTTTASTTSWTINADVTDVAIQTTLAGALTVNAPTGTLYDGQSLLLRIKDNGSARAITWNGVFRAIGVTLPSTTVAGKYLYIGAFANTVDTKWDVLAVAQEA
jgi:hypothetical protein